MAYGLWLMAYGLELGACGLELGAWRLWDEYPQNAEKL